MALSCGLLIAGLGEEDPLEAKMITTATRITRGTSQKREPKKNHEWKYSPVCHHPLLVAVLFAIVVVIMAMRPRLRSYLSSSYGRYNRYLYVPGVVKVHVYTTPLPMSPELNDAPGGALIVVTV